MKVASRTQAPGRPVRSPDSVTPVASNGTPKRIHPPKQARSEVTVRAIEQAVDEVVAEGGVTGLTTRAVAHRAGVSPGTLHQYFRTREALVASWELRRMQSSLASLGPLVSDVIAKGGGLEDVIWAITRASVHLVFDNLWSPRAGSMGFTTEVSERSPFVETAVDMLVKLVAASPTRDRILPKDVAAAMRTAIYVVCYAPYPVALRHPTAEQRETFARDIADMITRYLLGTPR